MNKADDGKKIWMVAVARKATIEDVERALAQSIARALKENPRTFALLERVDTTSTSTKVFVRGSRAVADHLASAFGKSERASVAGVSQRALDTF